MSTADYFTHLRAIRSAEDRLRLLRGARSAYSGAMREYLAQLDSQIALAEAELIAAHTDRVDSDPCVALPPMIRRRRNS